MRKSCRRRIISKAKNARIKINILYACTLLKTATFSGAKLFFKFVFGSSEEDEVSGFFVLSHLWMRGYFRLG